jgi:hypothetical protein
MTSTDKQGPELRLRTRQQKTEALVELIQWSVLVLEREV